MEVNMKVLRPAPTQENWSIKQYCTGWRNGGEGCGARLKVYREDLTYQPPDKDSWDGSVTFKCICCGKLTDIGLEYYPENYKNLKRRYNSN